VTRRGQHRERQQQNRRDHETRRDRAELVDIGQITLDDQRPDRVARDRNHDARDARPQHGPMTGVEADDCDDAAEADREPGDAQRADPLFDAEQRRDHDDAQRHRRDQDARQR